MATSDAILQEAARDGSIDIAEWPRLLESVLQKLHDIVYNEFPFPSIPTGSHNAPELDTDVVASTPPVSGPSETTHNQITQSTPGENELPSDSQNSAKENDVPMQEESNNSSDLTFGITRAQSAFHDTSSKNNLTPVLPTELRDLYEASIRILRNDFANSPPYTIQRLAEMILYPRKHYRFLPSYLRALDRIISVSSPVSDFPLPALNASLNASGFLTNGEVQLNGSTEREGLGSDESLGGALLTPIPWLRNNSLTGGVTHDGELHSESTETVDGPNGAGSIETVSVTVNGVSSANVGPQNSSAPASPTLSDQSDASSSTSSGSTEAQLRQQGGVTQGELLRQEQEAGVVPVSQAVPRRAMFSTGAAAVGREGTEVPMKESENNLLEDERPHARGPEIIGMEDMGPQHSAIGDAGTIDLEAAVGRAKSPPSQPRLSEAEQAADAMNVDSADVNMSSVDNDETFEASVSSAADSAEASKDTTRGTDSEANERNEL